MSEVVIGILATRDDFSSISVNPGDDIVLCGQQHLLKTLFQNDSIRWEPFVRYRPQEWFMSALLQKLRVHPKWLWPLWQLIPVGGTRLNRCDLLINASGPLLYRGQGYHTLFEPWALVLLRSLKAPGAPLFLNLALGTLFQNGSSRNKDDYSWLDVVAARRICQMSTVTTCRESLAQKLVHHSGHRAPLIPCASLLARRHFDLQSKRSDYVALNFHPKGSRSRNYGTNSDQSWVLAFRDLITQLSSRGLRYKLVCHEPREQQAVRTFLGDNAANHTILPATIPDFLTAYGNARASLTCRIHGAYAAASFGVSSLCITSDSRAAMIDVLDMPHLNPSNVTGDQLMSALETLFTHEERSRRKLLAMVDRTEKEYIEVLKPGISTIPRTQERCDSP
jgi:hypothetical protein